MGEGRPHSKVLLHVVQVVILFTLIQAVNTQTWYTGVVEVDYTEGLPEGAGMGVELEVDQETADGKVHIDGFLTFMQWQTTRNDTTIPSESSDDFDRDSFDLNQLYSLLFPYSCFRQGCRPSSTSALTLA